MPAAEPGDPPSEARRPQDRAARGPLVRHRTLHGHVVEWLGSRIVAGEFPVGSQLPTEEELAAQLGISRGGVREAVKALAAKGLVAPRPRVGTIAQPRERWNLLDSDVIHWRRNGHDEQFVRDLLELRLLVEPQVAGLAAERATPAEVDRLSVAATAMEETAPRLPASEAEFIAADLDFHLCLLRACGNELVGHLSRLLEAGLQQSLQITAHLPDGVAAAVPLHRLVAEAVGRGDGAGAAEAMHRILAATAAALETWPGGGGG
ncbi:MAG: FadR family transcriptional regulator [Acidimicrobiaceae bacterium]|nr:FadR family transcriptional regulator [Acidimicrobiaceae bacterium]